MQWSTPTFSSPADALAWEEALLDYFDESDSDREGLVAWHEPQQHYMVLGYGNRVDLEVDRDACRRHQIPILRRCSGGGTVLQGPGCLNYSLFLPIATAAALASISGTNRWIMEQNRAAIESALGRPVTVRGYTDLALDDKKFSGNAQRRKRRWLLFHGTFLIDYSDELLEACLRPPSREPDYRNRRGHRDFLTRLPLAAEQVREAVRKVWRAEQTVPSPAPIDSAFRLVREKYSQDSWNLRM